MRIDKFLSNMKYGTRNEIKKDIKNGYVFINGKQVKEAKSSLNPTVDVVEYDGQKVFYKERLVLMMNKPKGVVSATRDALHETVVDLIGEPYSRFDLNIAGRLDIDTEGLIVLTNDGTLLHDLITPKKNIYKKYYVEVDKPIDFHLLEKPMSILDGKNQPFTPMPPLIEEIATLSFYLSIKEGKFHQVKRMCQACGITVTYLKRVAIGTIVLDEKLELGEYKEI